MQGSERSGTFASPAWWWVLLASVPIIIRLLSVGLLEGGDTIAHYQIAVFSWQHPELFADMWGKPLFTLLASPFAQLGHWGMTVFNAMCFVATAWAADGILKRAGTAARWIFPPALLLVPVYGTMVIAGMTEILFGLLLILVIRSAWNGNARQAAIIASFMPFSRPEYVAFIPFLVVWIASRKQWWALAYLLTGPVIYSVVSAFVFGDPLWMLNGDPYTGAKNIYGNGPWDHFLVNTDAIFGTIVHWSIPALVGSFFILKRQDEQGRLVRLLFLLAVLPSLSIFILHSYLWAEGLKGSLGLFRVLATTAPMLVLFTCWVIVWIGGSVFSSRYVRIAIAVILGTGHAYTAAVVFLDHRPLPVPPDEQELFLAEVGERIKEIKRPGARVSFNSPLIVFYADIDPYSERSRAMLKGREKDLGMEEGDLVIWDAHFSPNEGNTQLQWLLEHPALTFIEKHQPGTPMVVLGGRLFEVFIFERRDADRWSGSVEVLDQRKDTMTNGILRSELIRTDEGNWRSDGSEFPLEISGMPIHDEHVPYSRVEVSGNLAMGAADPPLLFVLEVRRGDETIDYRTVELRDGEFSASFQIARNVAGSTSKLYIWNRSGDPFTLKNMRVDAFLHRSAPL